MLFRSVLSDEDEPGLEEVFGVVEALLAAAVLVDLERLLRRPEPRLEVGVPVVRRVAVRALLDELGPQLRGFLEAAEALVLL